MPLVNAANERRTLALHEARTDGWFERLAESSPSFDQLCEIVGERFVAFAVISGVRITAVTYDRSAPDASLIDFAVGQGSEDHRLPLGEFRRRLASSLLADEPHPGELPEDPGTEDLQSFIGFRYVLLAPVFGIRLLEMHVGGGEPARVSVEIDGERKELGLVELRDLVHQHIRDEVGRLRQASSPFSLDLEVVPKVEEANEAGDWETTIDLVGAWPGPLSLLLRTAEGQMLEPEAKDSIARALGLLGTAYAQTGRHQWAEEVMRLGIQWGQDGAVTGDLFRRLGDSFVGGSRHGEAIAPLRRGLALGADPADVLPSLAEAYAARSRYVAAMVCCEQARAAGVEGPQLDAVEEQAHAMLGEAWKRLREHVPFESEEQS